MTAHVRAGVLAFILLVATAPRPQAADPNVDGCARESNPKLKIEYCTRVIESGVYPEGDESWPYVNRCHAENEAGDLALAMQDCDKAIELNPSHAEAFDNRCWIDNNEGYYDRALRDCNEALRLNENDADAFNNLGITYASMGDFNKARWEFDQAIARKAEFATAYNNRCWLRIAMDDAIHAIEDCSRSLKLDPTDSNTWNSRGWAYLRADQFSKAVDDFNTVLLTDPDSSYALYGLSLAERRLGHSSDADKFLAAAKNRQADVEADLGRQHIWPPS